MGDDETRRLVLRASAGDPDAVEDLAERYGSRVRTRIHRRIGPELRTRVDTDDIFQTTFFAAIRGLSSFTYRDEESFVRWLAQVSERKMLMAVRRHRAGRRDLRLEWPIDEVGELPGALTSPTQGAVRGELCAGIRQAVDSLPEPDREVVVLHSFDGLGFREVAERVGLSDMHAARHVFRRALKRMGEILDPRDLLP